MAIKMVRNPSETPNINNIDDIVGLRYAYGNQNGYVIAKGNEVSHSVNGSTFTLNSGRLVLQGVEVDIDANGLDLTVDNIATKQYYSVYLTVNLALNTVQIQFTVDTAGYPEIDPGDDLTKNTSGIARLELYRFTAQNGVISEVSKVVQSIKYVEDRKVADSSKINNLELMQDENGILKIGNIIIPQKKLLWSGHQVVSSSTYGTILTTEQAGINGFLNGITIEIEYYVGSYTQTEYLKFKTREIETNSMYCHFLYASGSSTTLYGHLRIYNDHIEAKVDSLELNITKIYQIIE